jgi:DNA-binding CsgD family transcriptional regulator
MDTAASRPGSALPSAPVGSVGVLVGRDAEQRRIGSLIGAARNGHGGALHLVGEPGIGKTALLDDATGRSMGVRAFRVDGFEAESSIAYAAMQRLLLPLRAYLPSIPGRHQEALRVAAGVAEAPAPDRFLVGMGVLGLLAAAARTAPVLCVVDDAHHLDPESLDALCFVARRLEAESVALLFASRRDEDLTARMPGVPDLELAGLGTESAVRLLASSHPEPIDPAAAALIARATGGNPLALIDLARGMSGTELSRLGLADEPVPIGRRLEAHYLHQVRRTTADVRLWMLVAAADSTGNLDLIGLAADDLGVPLEAGGQAELAGLVELGASARFRHPLVRSAAYNAASGVDRRRVHGSLAFAADKLGLVELEAWHAAKAALGTDDGVADRLEHAADLAARRGGYASRANVLSRAADLSSHGPIRDTRLIAAAEAALAVGAAHLAADLLDRVHAESVDPVSQGRIVMVRTALALFVADPTVIVHGAQHMLRAADHFHGRAPDLEQRALVRAFALCVSADRLMQGVSHEALGSRFVEGSTVADGPLSVILRGLGALVLLPYDEAVGPARAAFDQIEALPDHELMQFGTEIASLGTFLWHEWRPCLERAARAARDAGALQLLDTLLWILALSELTGGSVLLAERHNAQVRELRRAIGYDAENVVNAALLAWTGAPAHLVLAVAEGAAQTGFGGVHASAVAALAIRDLSEGHYGDAFLRLEPLVNDPYLHVTQTQAADYAEAAVRSGRSAEATRAVEWLEARARANGSPWCHGVAERARALVSPHSQAEEHYRAAVANLAGTRAAIDLGRAHLLYGEWLRRTKRRREARLQLELALEHFDRTGAQLFRGRAVAELEATGIRSEDVGHHNGLRLTPQELNIAQLAATGHTNPEIAASLFISPNTVDYHLRKVFQKLGVSSRRHLSERLGGLAS